MEKFYTSAKGHERVHDKDPAATKCRVAAGW